MRPTIEDILDYMRDYQGDLSKDLKNLEEIEVHQIAKKMRELTDGIEKMKDKFDTSKETDSGLFTVEEAANYLKVSKQTIYNKIKDGSIICRRSGRNIRIEKDVLNRYYSLVTDKLTSPMTLCIKSVLEVNRKTNELLPFISDKMYRIVNENKIWIYLFNEEWGDIGRFSKSKYRKHFKNLTGPEVASIIYNT